MAYITSIERLGIKKGKQEGRQETVVSLIHNAKKKGFSEEVIAQFTNLDLSIVSKVLNNEPIEIPLHLLHQAEHP